MTWYPPLRLIEEARISTRTDPPYPAAVAGAPLNPVLTVTVKTLSIGPGRRAGHGEEAGEMVGERVREERGEIDGKEWVEGGLMSGTGRTKDGGGGEGRTDTRG